MAKSRGRLPARPSKEARNFARTRKNWSKVEDYLTGIEKTISPAKAWELRQRLERGEITLGDLRGY